MRTSMQPSVFDRIVNARISNAIRWLTVVSLLVTMVIVSTFVLWGVWAWNRTDINTLESQVDTLQNKSKFLQTDIFYVALNGSDSNSGRSWDHAFLTIARASRASSAVATSSVYIGPGTFDVNVSDATFINIEVRGTLDIVDTLFVENISTTDQGFKLVTVSETLTPGALENTFFGRDPDDPRITIIENDQHTFVGTQSGASINETGYVVKPATTINILPDTDDSISLAGAATINFRFISFTSTADILLANFPTSMSVLACYFDCGGGNINFMREGVLQMGPAYIANCSITGSAFATFLMSDISMDSASSLRLSQSKADLARVQMRNLLLVTSCTLTSQLVVIQASDTGITPLFFRDSTATMASTWVESSGGAAVNVQRTSVTFSELTIVGDVNNENLLVADASYVRIYNGFSSTLISQSKHILCTSSQMFLYDQDFEFLGPTKMLLDAAESYIYIEGIDLDVGDNIFTASVLTDAKINFDRTNVRIFSATISIQNISTPGILFSESQVTINDGVTILVDTTDPNAIEIADNSFVTVGEGASITLYSNATGNESAPLLVRDSSTFVTYGDQTLRSPLGVCVILARSSLLIHNEPASSTFTCGTNELFLQDLSHVIFDAASTATLAAGSANVTVLGGVSNATTLYLGTPDFLYNDGESGAGVQGCSLRVTAA